MGDHKADLEAHVECRSTRLKGLVDLAERVDRFVGVEPPPGGYGLAEAASAVFNGGSAEEIQAALTILSGWNFRPRGGWPTEGEETK